MRQVARALRVGAAAAALAPWVGFAVVRRGDSRAAAHLGRRLRGSLLRLGPSFVKAGQLLSTRRDLLPEALCDELSALHSEIAPPPPGVVRSLLRAGGVRESVIATIDWSAGRGGSVAAVYPATYEGRDVVLKVLRPGVRSQLQQDGAVVESLSRVVGRMTSLPLHETTRDIGAVVAAQCDLVAEADHLRALRSALPRHLVHVPEVVDELSGEGVLAMERVPSRSTDQLSDAQAATSLRLLYEMLFLHGLVHCDLHPGNLFAVDRPGGDPGPDLVMLDAGFTVRLSDLVSSQFAEFFLALAHGDWETCGACLLGSAAYVRPGLDLESFRDDVRTMVRTHSGLDSRAFLLASFAGDLFALQRRHGIHPPSEFAFPLVSLLALEGRIRSAESPVDFQAVAVPILVRAIHAGRVRRIRDREPLDSWDTPAVASPRRRQRVRALRSVPSTSSSTQRA